jgi:hypothetical protein
LFLNLVVQVVPVVPVVPVVQVVPVVSVVLDARVILIVPMKGNILNATLNFGMIHQPPIPKPT